ncbi:MAG: right-handed parallel beta-helix repeat-containing protein, partial [Eubacteriales bacterium]
RSGKVPEGGDYTVTDGEYLIFDSSDNSKTYDLNNAVIRIGVRSGESGIVLNKVKEMTLKNARIAVYGGAAVELTSSRYCTLTGIHISGNGESGFLLGGRANTVDACTVRPDDGGNLREGIVATGTDICVTNCNLKKLGTGIADRSENGALIENNLVTDCENGISTECPDTVIWYNTVSGGNCGIRAHFEKSEISAAMSEGYNILAAMNIVRGAETSLEFHCVSNGVVLLNKLENATVYGCTNAYVNENQISGELSLSENNYLIANGNTYASLSQADNANVNGDDLTDLNARAEVGVNEELLPHINAEQFVGMDRKQEVRCKGENRLNEYLLEQMKSGKTVIVPPGAYNTMPTSFSDIQDCTVYAYGVLSETGLSKDATAYQFTNCTSVTVKGLFIGLSIYAHTQGTVTKISKSSKSICFVADPGYRSDFSDTLYYGESAPGYYFKPGNVYPEIDFRYSSKTYDSSTNVNTLTGTSIDMDNIEVGDRVAFRTHFGAGGVGMKGCSEMVFEDVTVHSCSGFAEYDADSDVAPLLHRFAVVAGPAPVLNSNGNYEGFEDLLWTDSYGRLRSAEPLNTSCDATHSSSARVGIRLVSCLLERLNDDGGNINAYYGLASSFDSATNTLTYTTCNVNGYKLLPGAFREGDEIMLYSMSGKLVAKTTVASATSDLGNKQYKVRLSQNITLPENEQVVVQNLSASGRGFVIDNVMVRNSGANAFRLKASGGEIKNCTFYRLSKAGVVCNLEYWLWPEVGYTMDLKVCNNVISQVGNAMRNATPDGDNTWCAPISVRFSVAYKDSNWNNNFTSDPDYCLHENITISGNVITERFCPYAIGISGVKNISITDNVIGPRYGMTDSEDTLPPIALFGGNGIVIADNRIPGGASSPVDYKGGEGSYANLSFEKPAQVDAYIYEKSGYGEVIGDCSTMNG